jgi:hypothetical protein
MKWFTPLIIVPYGYQNKNNSEVVQEESSGWSIDQIADILGSK